MLFAYRIIYTLLYCNIMYLVLYSLYKHIMVAYKSLHNYYTPYILKANLHTFKILNKTYIQKDIQPFYAKNFVKWELYQLLHTKLST